MGDDDQLHVVLRALAEGKRRQILMLVRDQEVPAGGVAEAFRLTPQAVSQHLRVLRQAGLLEVRHDGTRRFYRLAPEGLASLYPFLAQLDARLAEVIDGCDDSR